MKVHTPPPVKTSEPHPTDCENCQSLIAVASRLRHRDYTEARAADTLKMLCVHLLDDHNCHKLTTVSAVTVIWEMQKRGIDGYRICHKVSHLCSRPDGETTEPDAPETEPPPHHHHTEAPHNKNININNNNKAAVLASKGAKDTTLCGDCVTLVTFAEEFVARDTTLQQIESFLIQTICNPFSVQYEAICESTVTQLPQIVTMLENFQPAASVCYEMGYCDMQQAKEAALNSQADRA